MPAMRRGSPRQRVTAQTKAALAARRLMEAHERREPFRPLPRGLAPRTAEEAYAIQDSFVALRAGKLGAAVAGYKIALASEVMRRMVGVDAPQAGAMLETTMRRSPARVSEHDYLGLIVEFEIGVEMAQDLPSAEAPFSRGRVAEAVRAVMPAIEIADDRNADYAELARHPLDLAADNAWSEGAVLGDPVTGWNAIDLAAVRGIARINGTVVGEGRGAEAMGHPFDAVAWLADHLAAHGRGLRGGDVIITGSLVTSKRVNAGDRVTFEVENLGAAELCVG